jgi:hypothetical protein
VGPVVPASSWELNPDVQDSSGATEHEEIWADFYSSFGSFTDTARLLYDPKTGSLGGPDTTDTSFLPPNEEGSGFLWFVVHDNRGGVAWETIPVTVN